MNRRSGLVVVTLIVLAIAAVVSIQGAADLRAESKEDLLAYLPVINSPFAPQLTRFVTDLAPAADGSAVVITDIVDPGDGRFFIASRDGRIQISSPDGSVQPDLLLDISDRVYDDKNESGLVGLAVHPEFPANPHIFVYFTELVEQEVYAVLAKYTVGPDGKADATTEERLLHIWMSTARHHAGGLQFGPQDGYLYISVGDGGTGLDSGNYGQRTNTMRGKILRIDVNNGLHYTVPADNPYVDDPHSLDEIWASGLRNPWRFSFDEETGDMYIGDVGETSWEEINFIPGGSGGGQNFGWSCTEGPDLFQPGHCIEGVTYSAPIFFYPHSQTGCGSVTAGFVYHGKQIPELSGQYIFGDLCRGRLWSLKPDGEQGWAVRNWGITGKNITTFGERHDGELFLGAKDVYQIVGTGQPE